MSQSPTEPSGAPIDGLFEVLDRRSLEILIEISGGDSSFLDRLFASFLSQCDRAVLEFGGRLEAGDATSLADLAHKIRGAAIQLGATAMASFCSEIEERSRSGRLEECADSIERLLTEYARARTAFERYRRAQAEG